MVEHLLQKHQLRKTPGRADVLSVFLENNHALGHKDLEDGLSQQYDRVTLYRILSQFEDAGIIHKVLDNSGVAKYALCHDDCDPQQHQDEHLHFECRKCQKTYCLHQEQLPTFTLPKGFEQQDMYVLLKGLCAHCR